jgi:hypothetical protein
MAGLGGGALSLGGAAVRVQEPRDDIERGVILAVALETLRSTLSEESFDGGVHAGTWSSSTTV